MYEIAALLELLIRTFCAGAVAPQSTSPLLPKRIDGGVTERTSFVPAPVSVMLLGSAAQRGTAASTAIAIAPVYGVSAVGAKLTLLAVDPGFAVTDVVPTMAKAASPVADSVTPAGALPEFATAKSACAGSPPIGVLPNGSVDGL